MTDYRIKEFTCPNPQLHKASKILVHVPRTGGTYFNNCLRANGVPLVDHVERFIDDRGQIKGSAKKACDLTQHTWISGHLRLSSLEAAFPESAGHGFYVLLRNPLRQLVSQVNWQAQSLRGRRLSIARMPNYPFRLLIRVCLDGIQQPEQLPSLLNRHFGYFLNNQSRSLSLMTGGRSAAASLNDYSIRAFDKLRVLAGFTLESGLDEFIDAALRGSVSEDHQRVMLPKTARNASSPFFTPALLEEAGIFERMIRLQRADFVLYLNARHLLSGGATALRWQDESSFLEDCASATKLGSSANPDRILNSRTLVQEKVNRLLKAGDALNPKRYRSVLRGMRFFGRALPHPIQQVLNGRRSIFRKLSALHALSVLSRRRSIG